MDPMNVVVIFNGLMFLLMVAYSIWLGVWFRRGVKAHERMATSWERWERRAETTAGTSPGGTP